MLTPTTTSASIFSSDVRAKYPDLYTGLGCIEGDYTIRLKSDAKPFAAYHNAYLSLPQLKYKIFASDVIRPVDEPTSWCTPIVVALKKTF